MSRLGRLAQLGGLTGRVTGSYLGNRLRDAFSSDDDRAVSRDRLNLENARAIVETVSRMKGAAMKLGQQLAVAGAALDLPEDVMAILGKLHSDGEPVPFDIIRDDVEKSLGAPLPKLFRDFDPKPLGSASLGQAHAARLKDGADVVVKVLHRGVEHSVGTDLMALKAVLVSGRMLRRPKEEVDEIFDEIRVRLEEELDYLQEAANIQAYQEAFAGDDRVRIPRIHHALCTERVLTMDRLPGKHLGAWLPTATPEARQRAADTLAHFYYTQLFRLRMLHADPHPGNYLFEDDGRLGILDFGCVKRFDPYWMASYAEAALATQIDDKERCMAATAQMGSWDGVHREDGELVWEFCCAVGRGHKLGPVVLGQGEQLMEEALPVLQRLLRNPRVRMPRDVIYTHRTLGGMYSLARQLGARVDYGAVLMTHVNAAIDAGRG